MIQRVIHCAILIASMTSLLGIATPSPLPARSTTQILKKMLSRNPTLRTYRVRVHVTTEMHSFPFLSPTLDGTSYYKRPGHFVVLFDHVPSYAAGFSKLFNNIADPGAWSKLNVITYHGATTWSGRMVYVLRIAPKHYSDILAYADALVDPNDWEIVEMTWHYRDGGTIEMRQWYRKVNGFSVLTEQSAKIDFRVHATSHATYGAYEFNVPIANSVFTGEK